MEIHTISENVHILGKGACLFGRTSVLGNGLPLPTKGRRRR
jgi:hypothetical protein